MVCENLQKIFERKFSNLKRAPAEIKADALSRLQDLGAREGRKEEPMSVLNSEQFVWLMTLTLSERRRIARALETREWKLVWVEETHSYELKRVE